MRQKLFETIGTAGHRALFLDLAMAPGAIAISGDSRADGRLAAALARQLCSAIGRGAEHATVVMAGTPFGLQLLHSDAALRWPSITEFNASWLPAAARFCFLFCTLSKASDAGRIQLLMENRTIRIVPIIVGGPLSTDWLLSAL
jgi:hypothetical protein